MNYFVKSKFPSYYYFFSLHIYWFFQGLLQSTEFLSLQSQRRETRPRKAIHSTDSVALFSHCLGPCKQSWEANNPDYSKPDVPNVTLRTIVVWSLHRGASEAVYSIAYRAWLCHQLRSATTSLLSPNIPPTPMFSMKNVIQNKPLASKRNTPGCSLGGSHCLSISPLDVNDTNVLKLHSYLSFHQDFKIQTSAIASLEYPWIFLKKLTFNMG